MPERHEEANQVKFGQYDYHSTLLIENMGQSLLIIALYALLVIVYVTTYCIKSVRMRLGALLLWNGLIRLMMELYLETALLSMHNVVNLEWFSDSPLYISSNILAIVFLILVVVLPMYLIYFFCERIEIWHQA